MTAGLGLLLACPMRTSTPSRGFEISYRVDGDGPPLLLLHGWSRWADDWWEAGYGEALVDRYRVIGVDWLGHGESDKSYDPADYREAPIAACTAASASARPERLPVLTGMDPRRSSAR